MWPLQSALDIPWPIRSPCSNTYGSKTVTIAIQFLKVLIEQKSGIHRPAIMACGRRLSHIRCGCVQLEKEQ
jgi:hypothetical protein